MSEGKKPSERITEIYNELCGEWWITGEPRNHFKWMQAVEQLLDEQHEQSTKHREGSREAD